ncbi:hypothetical protein BTHE_0100 [Bifidobacterium thermophilum]|nr:hypothetical protein BTHE_0100 [Bifidobacterium thermophilum]
MSIFSHTRMSIRTIVDGSEPGGGITERTSPKDAHSTGVGDSGRWSTRRIAMYACFVALSMALSFIEFPLIPGVQWLKYDPSGIVALVAGFAYGPAAALIVSILGFVPHLFINPWGTVMAWLVAVGMSVPAAAIYQRKRTRSGAALGLVIGTVIALVLAIVGNLIITPLYAHMTVSQVAALIVPALLPFNLAKYAINCVVTFLVYKPVSELLNRSSR